MISIVAKRVRSHSKLTPFFMGVRIGQKLNYDLDGETQHYDGKIRIAYGKLGCLMATLQFATLGSILQTILDQPVYTIRYTGNSGT